MAIQYYMRAFKTSVPTGYVDWVVNDTPDTTGAFSGFPTNELTNIIVNRVVTSKVDNFLKPNHSLRGLDGYYFHVNSYDWLRAVAPIGVPTTLTGFAVERGITSIATVTNATNTTPIVVTTTAHGLTIGQQYLVTIAGVAGNIGANGTFPATILNATSFTLVGSEGTGAWTSGGTVYRPTDFSTLTWDDAASLWRFVVNTNGDGATLGASQQVKMLNALVDGYVALGADPADTGSIRLSNNTFIVSESNPAGTDIFVAGLDDLNRIRLGSISNDIVYMPGRLIVDGYIVQDGTGTGATLTVPTTGFIRLPNISTILTFRHASLGANPDITVLSSIATNLIVLGDAVNGGIRYNTSAGNVHQFQVNTVPSLEVGNTFARFVTGVVSPIVFQVDNTTNSSVGQGLTLQSQNATGTTSTGGELNLTSGTGTPNDGNAGIVNIRAGGVNKLLVSPTVTTSNNADIVFSASGTRTGLATTTIAAGSNGAVLPQTTINVASTLGSSVLPAFPSFGVINIVTSAGLQAVYYTGTTGTTLTGCTGGTGTMSTGGAVTSAPFVTQNAVSLPAAKAQILTIQSQNNIGATSFGGDFALSSGTGTTQPGNVLIQTGGTNQIIVSPTFISPGTTTATTGSVVIRANLEVVGTTTTIDSTIVDIIGRVIHANWSDPVVSPNVAVPTQMTGYAVHRGNSSGFARDGAAWLWTEGAQNNGSDGHWKAATNPGDGYGTDNFTVANSTNNFGVQANNFAPTPDPNPVAGTLPAQGSVRLPNNLAHLVARNVSPTTTIAAASNLATLPQATINVASTAGFTAAGTLLIFSDAGVQTVTYTGTTGTTFTGAVGGTGLLRTGSYIAQTNRATTIAAGSNAIALPTGTINVASTVGFPASGTIRVITSMAAVTGQILSVQTVAYTGTTATTFTGCTGGIGTMFTGNSVSSLPITGNADLVLASTDFGNRVVWGSPSSLTGHIFNTPTNTLFDFQVNSIPQIRIQANDTNSDGYVEVLEIEPTVVNPRVAQLVRPDTGANVGYQLMLQAQNGQQQTGGNANNNGGNIVIASGAAGSGGAGATAVHGNVILQTDGVLKMTIFPTFAASASDSNTMLIEENIIRIGPTQNVPRIRQDSTTNANGQSFSLQSQNAATVGGPLLLQAGTGATNDGYINLITGVTTKVTIFPTTAISAADNNSILFFENLFRVDTAQITPRVRQDDETGASTNGEAFTLQAQNATGVTSTGGNLVLISGTGTTVAGDIRLQTGAVDKIIIHPTFTEFRDTAEALRITPVSSGTTQVTFASTVTAVSFNQTVTAGATGAPWTIQAQAGASGTGGNISLIAGNATTLGGNAIITSGTGVTAGDVKLQTGAVDRVVVHPTFTEFRDAAEAYRLTPVSAGTTTLQAASTVTALTYRQADLTTNAGTGATTTIQAQNETGTTSNGGALVLTTGTGTTVAGNLSLQTGAVDKIIIHPAFTEFRDTAEALRVTPVSAGTTQLTFASTVTAVSINQTATGSATGAGMTVQAQNALTTGGALTLTSGTGATTAGDVRLQTGAVDKVVVHPTFTEFRDTAEAYRITPLSAGTTTLEAASTVTSVTYRQANIVAATGANTTLQAQNATTTGGNIVITSGTGVTGGNVQLQTGAVDRVVVRPTFTEFRDTAEAVRITPVSAGTTAVQFASTVTAVTISQADLTANAGTGAPTTVQAQNETGTTSVGGALNLKSGTGTSTNGTINLQVGSTTTASLVTDKFVFNKGRRRNITSITSAAPYAVLASDDYIAITTLAVSFSINLPASPVLGDTYEIKDTTGNASPTVVVTVNGNGANIDGVASIPITTAYAAVTVTYTGTQWSLS